MAGWDAHRLLLQVSLQRGELRVNACRVGRASPAIARYGSGTANTYWFCLPA